MKQTVKKNGAREQCTSATDAHHKSEMEICCIEAESFKMMMMALLANNKKDG